MKKEWVIKAKISDQAHRVVRRLRYEQGLKVKEIVEQGLVLLGKQYPGDETSRGSETEVAGSVV